MEPQYPVINGSFSATRQELTESLTRPLNVPMMFRGEYRNPFDFIDEFEDWFTFEKRKHFDKESTFAIIRDMMPDDLTRVNQAMDANYSSMRFSTFQQFGKPVNNCRCTILT